MAHSANSAAKAPEPNSDSHKYVVYIAVCREGSTENETPVVRKQTSRGEVKHKETRRTGDGARRVFTLPTEWRSLLSRGHRGGRTYVHTLKHRYVPIHVLGSMPYHPTSCMKCKYVVKWSDCSKTIGKQLRPV